MKNRSLEALLLVLPLLLLPAALFGVSRGSSRAFHYPQEPQRWWRLVVASPQHEGIKNEFEDGFRRWLWDKERVGVDVTWLDHGGGTKTLRWIQERFSRSPDGIGVDVFFGGGTDPYEELKSQGLLQRYDPPPEVLEGVAPELAGFPIVDPDRAWFGTALTGFGIMLNRRVFEAVPRLEGVEVRDWEDLCDPRLRGWVGAADPRNSSSYHTFYEILIQSAGSFEKGMELVRRFGANVSSYSKYSIQVPQLCAVGQVACAPSIDQYVAAQIERVGPAIEFLLPEGKTIVNTDAAAILKGAPHPEAARRFIDFLLSPAAGRLWMLRVGEPGGPHRRPLVRASVRPSLYEEVAGRSDVRDNPFLLDLSFRYDYDKASLRWTLLNDLLAAISIDTHDELRAAVSAWERSRGTLRDEIARLVFADPLTEEEMLDMARRRWQDPAFRERKRIEWTEFARERYRRAAELAASGGVR